ncbi:Transposase [Roseimaritima multifibrata]|uniref:Transposase n=1 Tax=Roseimaritima multifibrata TaxID=1930274 RepID=A0A517MG14_9BACT|nr:transposase [Roseimaritima multifibrata]QDS93707.1 Transposase [Roseimaritima multifibrata]
MSKKRRRHSPEQIIKKLRDADSMLAAGKSVGEVLQSLEVSEATLSRWRAQYGGMTTNDPTKEAANLSATALVVQQNANYRTFLSSREVTRYLWCQ